MVPNVKIENGRGEVLDLSADPRYEPVLTGVGPVGATINSSKAGTADGVRYNSSTVGARNLLLTVDLQRDVARARQTLYKWLVPKQYIKVYYEADGLSVCAEGYVETAEVDPWTQGQNLAASIICPWPYWLDVAETYTNASHVDPLFEFPASIPAEGVELSTKDLTRSTLVHNSGTVEAGITFELKATLRSLQPRIYNLTTGEYMGFYVDMEPGDVLRVTTAEGNKRVILLRDGVEHNAINTVMEDSGWPKLAIGVNEFSYTVDEGEIALGIYHTNQYVGV
jgi:hypothetical protein